MALRRTRPAITIIAVLVGLAIVLLTLRACTHHGQSTANEDSHSTTAAAEGSVRGESQTDETTPQRSSSSSVEVPMDSAPGDAPPPAKRHDGNAMKKLPTSNTEWRAWKKTATTVGKEFTNRSGGLQPWLNRLRPHISAQLLDKYRTVRLTNLPRAHLDHVTIIAGASSASRVWADVHYTRHITLAMHLVRTAGRWIVVQLEPR